MRKPLVEVLRSQICGITGVLLVVGLTFHYTMETWWLGWTLPLPYLVGYALVGLTLVLLSTRHIGFHKEEVNQRGETNSWWYAGVEFAENFIASYVILLVLGIGGGAEVFTGFVLPEFDFQYEKIS